MRGELDVSPERFPVELTICYIVPDVDASKIADVVRKQRLLATWIRGFVRAEVRDRVVPVGLIYIEDARLARSPRAEDHLVPDHLSVELSDDFLGLGMNEVVVALVAD